MSIQAKVIWNGDKIKINAARATERSLFKLGEYAVERARQYAPEVTGYLRASIQATSKSRSSDTSFNFKYNGESYEASATGFKVPSSDRTIYVGSSAPYAMAIEFGIPYRKIQIRNKKILSDGTKFFGVMVEQRDIKATPYLRPAMDDTRAMAPSILREKYAEVFNSDVALRLNYSRPSRFVDI